MGRQVDTSLYLETFHVAASIAAWLISDLTLAFIRPVLHVCYTSTVSYIASRIYTYQRSCNQMLQ